MNIEQILQEKIKEAFQELYQASVEAVSLQPTKKEFEGSHTFVTFPYGKVTRQKPEESAQKIGEYLQEKSGIVSQFNVVKGFLNVTIPDRVWLDIFNQIRQDTHFGVYPANGQKVMVEFSSPNTNKPLHLGHLRNNFLGYSVAQILEACGYEVVKAKLVNDRGIHICKSMVAYQKFGNGETPQSSGIKGDHLAGKYYVEFDKALKEETKEIEKVLADEEAFRKTFSEKTQEEIKTLLVQIKKAGENEDKKKLKDLQGNLQQHLQNATPLLREAKDMLQKWEAGEEKVVALWKQMNGWVYEGFDATYKSIGVHFDKIYYESDTYILGKDIVEEGLQKGILYQKEDGSVWVDFTAEKLGHKLLLRKDGTSVYMTQDLGTADLKYKDFAIDKSVYVVGNEQDYHFHVLFLILKKLGRSYAEGMYHLSYGMVDLPSGKMKSREGTVVDADELVEKMIGIATARTQELGKTDGFSEEALKKLYQDITLGALKYFLLRVDPQKRMLFDPKKSIDFQGDSGPFIQFNFARTCSILRTAREKEIEFTPESYKEYTHLQPTEHQLLSLVVNYAQKVKEAGENYDPSTIAQYVYEVAKAYSQFFTECSIFKAESEAAMSFRLALSEVTAQVIQKGMNLLGINVPERM